MRKILLFCIAIISVFLLAGNSKPGIDGILLKDSNIYKTMELRSGKYLKNIIVLPNQSTYDNQEVKNIVSRLDQIGPTILKKADSSGIKVKLFQGKLTDNPTASYLKGKTPRGYQNKSITWDSVPGIGGSQTVLVKIGYSEKGKGHGSVDLELHELAHSLDRILYNNVSTNQKFMMQWKTEVSLLFPNNSYYLYSEEYFAETFAMYYYSDETKNRLKQIAPRTYMFISMLK